MNVDNHADRFTDLMPLVSIIIPSYNHAHFVKQCIESVIAQDYNNIEMIIIDDGSSDNSVSVIDSLVAVCRERFVRFEFRSRSNLGLAVTLNEALLWAEGEYFSMLSSDDVMLPEKTTLLVHELAPETDVAGVFSGCEYIDGDGQLIGAENHPLVYFAFDDVLAHRHFLQTPTQLLRTSYLREAGGYLEDVYIEDWYMWLKLTEVGRQLKNIPDNLVQYRYHATNISKQRQHMFEARKQILDYFRQHKGYRHALSIMCIWAAIDFSCTSKIRSMGCLFQALATNPSCLFSRYFAKGLLRWLTPCFIVRRSETLKARCPRLFAYLPDKF